MRKDAQIKFWLKWQIQQVMLELSFSMFFFLLDIFDQQRGYLWTTSPPYKLDSPLNPQPSGSSYPREWSRRVSRRITTPQNDQVGLFILLQGNIFIPYFYFQITKKPAHVQHMKINTQTRYAYSLWSEEGDKEGQNIYESVQVQQLTRIFIFKTVRLELGFKHRYLIIQFPIYRDFKQSETVREELSPPAPF